jgi:mono/diheme cytochrome c family protein
MLNRLILTVILILVVVLSGCASGGQTPSTTSPAQSTATASAQATSPTGTSSPATGGQTYAQAAEAGKTVYSSNCANCHGANGQGGNAPALIGQNANLGKYKTAQGLYDFTSSTMPINAPGSLSETDYQNLVGFLLVQNNYVTPTTSFDPGQFQSIQLNK